MAAVHSPEFLIHPKASTISRTAARTGAGKTPGNRTRIRMGAAATGQSPPSIAPRAPKLRDSCNACAAAKVRCTKQKPTCTRCHKSGLDCEYNATRRAGRPSQASTTRPAKVAKALQHTRRNNAPSEVHIPSRPDPCTTIPSAMTPLASPRPIESPSKQQHTMACLDNLPNHLTPTDSTAALPSSLTAFSAEFDDFFTSLGSFSGLETPTYDLLSLPSCVGSASNAMGINDTAAFLHDENFSITDETCSDMQIPTPPHSLSNSRQSSTSHVENSPALWPETPCCCLITALGFLKELVPSASKAYPHPCEQQTSISEAEPAFPTIQSVIAQNERIVEAMDSILQCPYSQQDGYLLTVLSLVLFKILDWYTAAGRAAPTVTNSTNAICYDSYNNLHASSSSSSPHTPIYNKQMVSPSSSSSSSLSQFSTGSLCVDDEDSGRVAAQMVLSELHRAQRLVNNLSALFKGHVAAPQPNSSTTADGIDILCDVGKGTWPISTSMFDQLEADLRSRLRTVSLVVVDMIRRV